MTKINPLQLLTWTFRRHENDVINLYNALSDLMKIVTNGDFLNFGYWENSIISPIDAQTNLCKLFAKKSQLKSEQKIADVGSGKGSPALQWYDDYFPIQITCININYNQIKNSNHNKLQNFQESNIGKNFNKNLDFLNATSTSLPLKNDTYDRVLSLESAHHFRPLSNFLAESKRILKPGGILSLAIPVITEKSFFSFTKLGILSFTWSSEHYSIENLQSALKKMHFKDISIEKIGDKVYPPLADYYMENRIELQNKILLLYPSYVEKILYHSLKKMKHVSQKNIIDYILLTCKK